MTGIKRRRLQVICSSQAPESVASCEYGKQRRTKAGKEKTEKTENLIAKISGNPRHALFVCPGAKRWIHCVAGYLGLARKRIQSPYRSRLANRGAFAIALFIRPVRRNAAPSHFSPIGTLYPPTVQAACSAESSHLIFATTGIFQANQYFSAGQLHSRE